VMKQSTVRGGYKVAGVCVNGKQYVRRVHQLVMLAFVGECPDGQQVCHDDGNPANNALGNLRYGTPAANAADRDRHGTTARGERSGTSKLTAEQVAEIRAMKAKGCRRVDIATRFGVTPQAIGHVMKGKLWRHVT
jgi:hypothetical protein